MVQVKAPKNEVTSIAMYSLTLRAIRKPRMKAPPSETVLKWYGGSSDTFATLREIYAIAARLRPATSGTANLSENLRPYYTNGALRRKEMPDRPTPSSESHFTSKSMHRKSVIIIDITSDIMMPKTTCSDLAPTKMKMMPTSISPQPIIIASVWFSTLDSRAINFSK